MKATFRCQATRSKRAEIVLASEDPHFPYRLSRESAARLQRRELWPREWLFLAAVHGSSEFEIHEDWYDSRGRALQPLHQSLVPPAHRFPEAAEILGNDELILDVALASNLMGSASDDVDVMSEIRRRDSVAMSELICRRINEGCSSTILSMLHQLLVDVHPARARMHALQLWDTVTEASIGDVIRASVGAMSESEIEESYFRWSKNQSLAEASYDAIASALYGLTKQMSSAILYHILAGVSNQRRPQLALGLLAPTRERSVLQWIEANIATFVLTGEWGQLAAACGVDGPKLLEWLRSEPLCLVALDAITLGFSDLMRDRQAAITKELRPVLSNPPSQLELQKACQDLSQRATSHRIQKSVKLVMDHWDLIRKV